MRHACPRAVPRIDERGQMIETRRRHDRQGRAYTVYRVRAFGVNKTLPRGTTRKQAERYETRVKQAAQTGTLDQLHEGSETVAEFAERWWSDYAATSLAPVTLESYARIWHLHLLPRIGGYRLRELRPQVVAQLAADLERAGLGAPTIKRALAILQGMMQRAVEWEHIAANPVKVVRKPTVVRQRAVRPLPPVSVEAIRAELRQRDAAIVSCLAYSGPRPSELLVAPLEWAEVGRKTLLYSQGKLKRSQRHVRLTAPLAQDLAEWRLAEGRATKGPVFPAHDGKSWEETDWRNWRRRVFQPAAKRAGVKISRPYDLRHTWASLLIQEGRLSVVEIAAQMGHSTQTLLSTYAHVIAELSGEQRPVEELIRDARRPRNVPTSAEQS